MGNIKTHWLQNPNKNYLGHWDLPNGNDVVLTIDSARWEEVKDPITNRSDSKRVIRFSEKHAWVKPMICNQVNAQMILKCTGENFMEDCRGKKIKISVSTTRVKGEEVDCLRVKNVPQAELFDSPISDKQASEIAALIKSTNKTVDEICKVFKIEKLSQLPASKYSGTVKRLKDLANVPKNS